VSSNPKLEALPQSLASLSKLTSLQAANCNLRSLPPALSALPLSQLDLRGNPLLGIPESVLGTQNAQEILRYYFESRDEKGFPLLELKLLVVGRGGAGKTSLIKQLAHEMPRENEPETHSIAIRELSIPCNKRNVRAHIWDFGGQEILHATHQFFLTERSLYLLVLEPRSGTAQQDAEYWLRQIQTQGGESPVLVVMNWSRRRAWKVDEVKLKRKFPFIVDFISTDAMHGEGINQLEEVIRKTIQEQVPDVWQPFPRRWREIKDTVAAMKENFLTYDQYVALCVAKGENDPAVHADLAAILHALGLVLYFGNDPRLKDMRVLNPRWVTGGVYAVIRSDLVEKQKGQLSVEDMKAVLAEAERQNVVKASDYPPPTHPFILELMRAFQLCYASEESKGKPSRYLVPELLPAHEPNMAEQEWERAPVRLRYQYEVLPPGLIPRFIVRTHALGEGMPQWRHGDVITHGDAAALVRQESNRELQVFVTGQTEETRGVLVAIVRNELHSLHDEMKVQAVEELELSGEGERWISVKSLREIERPDQHSQTLPVQPEGTKVVNVPLELNKLVPSDVRELERKPARAPVRLFVSYAQDDKRRLKQLDSILEVLEQQHGLAAWSDMRLIAGDEWDARIRQRLEEMDIFLFVASHTSLARPYIRDPEIRIALKRHEAGEVEIVVVKLEPCACDEDRHIGKFQRLGQSKKSVSEIPRAMAWEQVRKSLLPVIESVRKRKPAVHPAPVVQASVSPAVAQKSAWSAWQKVIGRS
jgi:internalin A